MDSVLHAIGWLNRHKLLLWTIALYLLLTLLAFRVGSFGTTDSHGFPASD